MEISRGSARALRPASLPLSVARRGCGVHRRRRATCRPVHEPPRIDIGNEGEETRYRDWSRLVTVNEMPRSSCGIVYSKQEKPMTRFALYVPLQAKPGREKDVADFLRSAVSLVNAEPGTITWFAIQEGPSSFAIFDTFNDEAGREAHLNGKVAAALIERAKAGDLFAQTPEIHKLEILADKLPK
jgi:quinol monooxygenase YgiN